MKYHNRRFIIPVAIGCLLLAANVTPARATSPPETHNCEIFGTIRSVRARTIWFPSSHVKINVTEAEPLCNGLISKDISVLVEGSPGNVSRHSADQLKKIGADKGVIVRGDLEIAEPIDDTIRESHNTLFGIFLKEIVSNTTSSSTTKPSNAKSPYWRIFLDWLIWWR